MEATPVVLTYPGIVFSQLGDVGMILWHGESTIAANRWLVSHITAARRAGKDIRVGIQLISDRAGLPDADARRYVQEAFREELPRLRRFVNAPLGDSMKQSLVRTVLRGMAMIGDANKVIVIVSTIEEALEMAVRVASDLTPSRSELSKGIDALFAEAGLERPRAKLR